MRTISITIETETKNGTTVNRQVNFDKVKEDFLANGIILPEKQGRLIMDAISQIDYVVFHEDKAKERARKLVSKRKPTPKPSPTPKPKAKVKKAPKKSPKKAPKKVDYIIDENGYAKTKDGKNVRLDRKEYFEMRLKWLRANGRTEDAKLVARKLERC